MESILLLNLNFSDYIFETQLVSNRNYFFFNDLESIIIITNYDFLFKNLSSNNVPLNAYSFSSFIEQAESNSFFSTLENVQTIYHYSIPSVKLLYPEPFIASASFMHSDLWFVHILVYQYWLWFVFIFIIVFFLITFLCIVRWCNARTRPRRETRGVSRSKCGDLITAIVPVSWAASIIISESTDAIDYFDGFGTTELIVGIRAYQWGWEYYYPKDLDLNYNIKKNYSTFTGNSLKYNKASNTNIETENIWKFYQNKPYDFVVTPAHLLLLPSDNLKLVNFLNFSDVGINVFHESSLFKQTRSSSKTLTNPLFFSPSDFSIKYQTLSPLFNNDAINFDSFSYGLKKQHNFISNISVGNNFSTLFSLYSVNKLLSNFGIDENKKNTTIGTLPVFLNKSLNINRNYWNLNSIFSTFFSNHKSFFFNDYLFYENYFEKFNNNSDKKKFKFPHNKFFNFKSFNTKLINNNVSYKYNPFSFKINNVNFFESSLFSNKQKLNKTLSLFSSNFAIIKPEQTVRKFSNISLTAGNYNLSGNSNPLVFYQKHTILKNSMSILSSINFFNSKWVDLSFSNKLISNRLYLDSPAPALASNNPLSSVYNYDNYKNSLTPNTPMGFQERDELTPSHLPKIYWNLLWGHTDSIWRITNTLKFQHFNNLFYFPFFTLGYDYDFRNWQSFALLEDAYWENLNSSYFIEEYSSLLTDYSDYQYFDKLLKPYLLDNRISVRKDYLLSSPYFFKPLANGNNYLISIFAEETLPQTNLIPTWLFNVFFINSNSPLMDDSYELIKSINLLFYLNTKLFVNFSYLSTFFQTHWFVVDSFRSDVENFNWDSDTSFSQSSYGFESSFYSLFIKNLPEIFNNDNSFFSNFNKTLKMDNLLVLRNTSKDSILNYNSYQKVFKSRFDENRSHTKSTDLSNLFIKQNTLSEEKVKYERLLGKNKNNFHQSVSYKNEFLINFNSLYDVFNSINYFIFDIPFLLALKSDASRYLWFDWFAKWGMYEVQPSSASRYAISGVPYFNRCFDFNSESNNLYVDSENYFTRITKARKNYLPSWAFTPQLYSQHNLWFKNNSLLTFINNFNKSIISIECDLELMTKYWISSSFLSAKNILFSSSNSDINSFARSNWKPISLVSSYYYHTSSFLDILSKREFLLRQYLFFKKKIIRLPLTVTNNPNNPLLLDLKAAFVLIDPTTFSNEYSRNIYYSTLSYFQFNVLNVKLSKSLPSSLSATKFFNNYKFLFEHSNSSTNINTELLKSQYRPMRRGITNMIRLHGTGAVAMPMEIRLQVLASSKDVIHSWAVPSAGIKIDCVPGYTSHRVMIFLVSGIFWGQCMEVCGRYHHWMPIIVYFMKRDLFFLWCTHFVFVSGSNNMWNINDKEFSNYLRLVSYDKSSWASEIK